MASQATTTAIRRPSEATSITVHMLLWTAVLMCATGEASALAALKTTIDPLTRYIHIGYALPNEAPAQVVVQCSWSPPGAQQWRPAAVRPLISETALELLREDDWRAWMLEGRIVERRGAGLQRTVVFNPYPEAQRDGRVDVDFRIELADPGGQRISAQTTRVQADNADVVYIEDWIKVLQFAGTPAPQDSLPEATATGAAPGAASRDQPVCAGWNFRSHVEESRHVSFGNALYGTSPPDRPLMQLTYPLDLKGWYAIYAVTEAKAGSPGPGSIRLRLSGDEPADFLGSRRAKEEVLWKWARMDRQSLVLRQPHLYTGYGPAHIDYVKMVPLTPKQVEDLEAQFGTPDKLVAGYWEPYSWAFSEDVQTPAQHREPLTAFAWARIGLVDTQLGRMGMKVVYESRLTDQLLYGTLGDPVEGCPRPITNNVGRMQQYTNTLQNELTCARELGLNLHANFGAGACYNGTTLQGDISKQHPEWRRGNTLRYELPEVRRYAVSLFRESLELGAPGISIDFCRYPEGVDTAETCNTLLRELRAMTQSFAKTSRESVPAATGAGSDSSTNRGAQTHIPMLIRFPGTGVRLAERFDYRTWAREGLVDYLCPSNIQGRHLHIDIAPYVDAVKGTSCRLLPAFDGLTWGLALPGPFFWRVQQLYDVGVPGIYVYQADGRVLGRPSERRWMRMLSSSEAIRKWWQREMAIRPHCSKGIYLSAPEAPGGVFHGYERLRIWTEGVGMADVEAEVDGKLVGRFAGPPYLMGTEAYESDKLLTAGQHTLKVRARDGEGWLEQEFTITTGK